MSTPKSTYPKNLSDEECLNITKSNSSASTESSNFSQTASKDSLVGSSYFSSPFGSQPSGKIQSRICTNGDNNLFLSRANSFDSSSIDNFFALRSP